MRVHINDLFDIANQLKLAHRYGEAEQAYRAILSARPEDDGAALNLALTLLEVGRSHEGVVCIINMPGYNFRYTHRRLLVPTIANA